DRFVDRGGRERRRHVDHRDVGAGLRLRLLHRREDRDALVDLAGLPGVYARDVAVAAVRVFLAHLGVEHAGLAGDALRHHPGVLVDQDGHQRLRFFWARAFFFAGFFATFLATFFAGLLFFGFVFGLAFDFDLAFASTLGLGLDVDPAFFACAFAA